MHRFITIQNRRASQVTTFAKTSATNIVTFVILFISTSAHAINVAPGGATVTAAPRSAAATVAPGGKDLTPAVPGYNVTSVVQAPPTVIGGSVVPYAYGACGVPMTTPVTTGVGGTAPVFGTTNYSVAPTVPGAYSPSCVAAPAPTSGPDSLAMAGCALGALGGMKDTNQKLDSSLSAYNDSLGNQPEPTWSKHQTTAAELGQIVTNAKGCENFVNKKGEVGPWGRVALAQIKENRKAFYDSTPRDIGTFCPKFSSFDDAQKEMFYVNVFSAMASPESSCNPNNVNPNGTNRPALGLFQLEHPACGRVGMGSANLLDPDQNTKCAVLLFGKELENRGSIMSTCSSTCSNPKNATYWAPLRSDKRDAGNTTANLRFQSVAKSFPGCH